MIIVFEREEISKSGQDQTKCKESVDDSPKEDVADCFEK